METEHQLCQRYEAELASIAALDYLYYRNPSPTLPERRDYAARQAQIEELRSRFYTEFQVLHELSVIPLQRRCRSFIRKPRLR